MASFDIQFTRMKLLYFPILACLIFSGKNDILVNNVTDYVKTGYRQMNIFEPSFGDQGNFICNIYNTFCNKY